MGNLEIDCIGGRVVPPTVASSIVHRADVHGPLSLSLSAPALLPRLALFFPIPEP